MLKMNLYLYKFENKIHSSLKKKHDTRDTSATFTFFLNKFQRAITIEFEAIWILPARWNYHWLFILKNNHLRLHSSTRAVSWPQIKSMVDGWIDLRVIDTIRNNNSCNAFFLSYSCFSFFSFHLFSVYLYIFIFLRLFIYFDTML